MADELLNAEVDTKAEKKRLKEERKKIKADQKAQKPSSVRRRFPHRRRSWRKMKMPAGCPLLW